MLSRKDHFMIKQLHQQGAFVIDIAGHIGCSERSVRRHLKCDSPPTGKRVQKRFLKLEPFTAFVDSRLSEQVWNAEVIFQELKELGYQGGRAVLRRYIHPKRPLRSSKKTVRFETNPGQQLQHDWGSTTVEMAGKPCKVNIAVNTLGYSRRIHVFAAPSQDAEHTYESIVRAFNHFGGGVKTVLVDNQKAAVLKHSPRGEVQFNEGFLQLAGHYGFTPKACRVRRAQTKGKVERAVGYVKGNFFVRYRQFESYSHLNLLLEQWLDTVADQRQLRYFEQTPQERFSQECQALSSLPARDFDTSYFDVRKVAWDSYIEVRGNRYSVPERWCGQTVSIRITLEHELKVYGDEQLIAHHRLCDVHHGWRSIPGHHQALWQAVNQVASRPLSVYAGLV